MTRESDLQKIKHLLDSAENNIREAKAILFESELVSKAKGLEIGSEGKTIEGVFDGEEMIGPDKRHYQIPANYASKSKLVAGDVLKLTILDDGSFVYKQIGPVRRKKIVGTLSESAGKYTVVCTEGDFQVLPASISYFKAKPGDKLTILIPEDDPSEWAAVENLIESRES